MADWPVFAINPVTQRLPPEYVNNSVWRHFLYRATGAAPVLARYFLPWEIPDPEPMFL
jgi:hypothetical protein